MLSARSRKELATCHADLQRLFRAVSEIMPVEVICGRRGKAAQDQAFKEKRSRLKWPDSLHNVLEPGELADACDVVPLPVDWENLGAFRKLAEVTKSTALKLGIDVIWGGDWPKLKDMPHWERVRE